VAGHRRDYCFTRLNTVGDTLYTFTVGGSQDDHGQSLIRTSTGDFVMAGTSSSFVNGSSSYLVKVSESIDCCGLYTSGYTGNTDCLPDGKRNIADITRVIDRVYLTKTPLCCEENGNTDGDIDGKMNIADITRLIDNIYLSKEETAACE